MLTPLQRIESSNTRKSMGLSTLVRALAVAIVLYTAFASLLGTLVMMARQEVAGGMVNALRGGALLRLSRETETEVSTRWHDASQALAADRTVRDESVNVCQDRYGYLGGHATLKAILDNLETIQSGAPSVLQKLKTRKYFVAALLHNNEDVFSFWQRELLKVVVALGQPDWSNVYISVYESGSSDLTKLVLLGLDGLLKTLGVPHSIEMHDPKAGLSPTEQLARLRNAALRPLFESRETFDQVVYLNDIYFCAGDVLDLVRMVAQHGADYSCSVDYVGREEGPEGEPSAAAPVQGHDETRLYDTWVARDAKGANFVNDWPYICDADSQALYDQGIPFQVFTCWNGMVAISADVFQQLGVRFRAAHSFECRLSECDLLARDLWAHGRNKVVMVPTARTAYHWEVFESVALRENHGVPMDFAHVFTAPPLPREVACCPLDDGQDTVRFEECFHDANWRLPYEAIGTPRALVAEALEAVVHVPQNLTELGRIVQERNVTPGCVAKAAALKIPARLVHYGNAAADLRRDQQNKAALAALSYVARHPCWEYERLDGQRLETLALTEFPQTVEAMGYIRNPGLREDLLRLSFVLSRGGVFVPAASWGMQRFDELLRPEDELVVGVGVDRESGERTMLFMGATPGNPAVSLMVANAVALLKDPHGLYDRMASSRWGLGPPEDRERFHGAGLGLVLYTVERVMAEEAALDASARAGGIAPAASVLAGVRIVEYPLATVEGIVGKPADTCRAVAERDDHAAAEAAYAAAEAAYAAAEAANAPAGAVAALMVTGGGGGGGSGAGTWTAGPVAVHREAMGGMGSHLRVSKIGVKRSVTYDHLVTDRALLEGQYLQPYGGRFIPVEPFWQSPPLSRAELDGWKASEGLFLWVPYGGAAGVYAGRGPLDPRAKLLRKLCDKPESDLPKVEYLTMLVLQQDLNLVLAAELTKHGDPGPSLVPLWDSGSQQGPRVPPEGWPEGRPLGPTRAFLILQPDGRLALYPGVSPRAFEPIEPYSHPNFLPFATTAPGMQRGTHPSLVLIGTAKGGTSDFHQLIMERYCHVFNVAQVKELDGLRYTGGYSGRMAYERIVAGDPHNLPIPSLNVTPRTYPKLGLPYDLQKYVGNAVYTWRLNATGPLPYTIDATPTYLDWGPADAVFSLKTITEWSNVIAFLREPVSRTHSLFNHWLIMRQEKGEVIPDNELSFEREVELQLDYFDRRENRRVLQAILEATDHHAAAGARERLQKEVKNLLGKEGTDYYSPLLSSLYLPSLLHWDDQYFKMGRALIIQSDVLFKHKKECMEQVIAPFLFPTREEREYMPKCASSVEYLYETDSRKAHYHRLAYFPPRLKCRLYRFYMPFTSRMLDELRRMSSRVYVWPPVDTEEGTWWADAEEKYCGDGEGADAPPDADADAGANANAGAAGNDLSPP